MSLDDIYDDDFHSDEDDSESRALSDSNLGSKTESSLMPIIEVPSEGTESARTSEAPSARNLSVHSLSCPIYSPLLPMITNGWFYFFSDLM